MRNDSENVHNRDYAAGSAYSHCEACSLPRFWFIRGDVSQPKFITERLGQRGDDEKIPNHIEKGNQQEPYHTGLHGSRRGCAFAQDPRKECEVDNSNGKHGEKKTSGNDTNDRCSIHRAALTLDRDLAAMLTRSRVPGNLIASCRFQCSVSLCPILCPTVACLALYQLRRFMRNTR